MFKIYQRAFSLNFSFVLRNFSGQFLPNVVHFNREVLQSPIFYGVYEVWITLPVCRGVFPQLCSFFVKILKDEFFENFLQIIQIIWIKNLIKKIFILYQGH